MCAYHRTLPTALGWVSPSTRRIAHKRAAPLRAISTSPSTARSHGIPSQHTTSKLPPPLSSNPRPVIPAFRVLDAHGKMLEGAAHWAEERSEGGGSRLEGMADRDLARKVYETMSGLPHLDTVMSNIQRQGRISFYMTSYGEEAAVVCSAAAWNPTDEVFAQYREQGLLIYRGFPLDGIMAQCFSTAADTATRGRQMPVHYASKEHHFHPISSPLATQIPQAAGAAYSLKRSREKGERMQDCVVCYLGEGAASEGDFHAGMNMASVLGGPCVFFVRNNGFAISTPASQQFRGDGIASRAAGYGMDVIRVDGNDPVAVYLASREAKRRAIEGEGRSVLVEALTYRVGHHSTSDDSSAYRNKGDVEHWKLSNNPLHRMRRYLEDRGWWSSEEEDALKKRWKDDITAAVRKAEKTKKPAPGLMWEDAFHTLEPHLLEQKAEGDAVRKKWGAYLGYLADRDKHERDSEATTLQ